MSSARGANRKTKSSFTAIAQCGFIVRSMPVSTSDVTPDTGRSPVRRGSFLGKFTVLRGAVGELWIVFGVKLLSVVAYSLVISTLALWLSSDLGFGDVRAGLIVAAWSSVLTLVTVLVGSFTDAIGLRKTFLLGLYFCLAARAVLTVATAPWVGVFAGLLPLAIGEALAVPVMVAAVQRYTTTAQRSISFSIAYAMMNGGFLIGSYIFDYVRKRLGEQGSAMVPLIHLHVTTYRTLFLISFAFDLVMLPLLYFGIREGVEATDHGVVIVPPPPKHAGEPFWSGLVKNVGDIACHTVRIFGGLWRQPGFYKFLAFLSLAAMVRLIFPHMYYTYPKFGIRELGEGAPTGHLFAINSILTIFLVPIVGALSQRISAYRMVMVGSAIAAASVFIMAAPPQWFEPLADGPLGHVIANWWLDGYYQFSPDDYTDLTGLAKKLESAPWANALGGSFSPVTEALLSRQLTDDAAGRAAVSRPSTALLSSGDIRDAAALVARLRNDPDTNTRPVSQFIWKRLPGAEEIAGIAAEQPARLAEALNGVLKSTPLYDPERFARAPLSGAASNLVFQASTPGATELPGQLLLLNRLLLEDVCPREIARSSHPLRVALTGDLNKLIHGGPLYAKPGFSGVTLSGASQRLVARKPTGKRLVHLNRLIIEDAFPTEIARNRVGVPGSVNPYYVMIFLFIVFLSVGESVYSPRLYEYAAAIAPKGQEASYMALSYLPFFLAKLFVTGFSGLLLARYCPETGPRNSAALWLVIALTTTIAPVGLILLRRYIRAPEAGRD